MDGWRPPGVGRGRPAATRHLRRLGRRSWQRSPERLTRAARYDRSQHHRTSRCCGGVIMADEFTGFTSEAFSFWKGLERNNNRDWFQAHKDQYEQAVRRPMQLLIEELAPLYGPGRLSRINKDMRFQKEKP